MKNIKYKAIISGILLTAVFVSCEKVFDNRIDTDLREDQVYKNYGRVTNLAYNVYNYIPDGYNSIDGAYIAGATDDAEHTWDDSKIRLFNEGSWSEYVNPDNNWIRMYEGIRAANLFLEQSKKIDDFLVADTFTPTDKVTYEKRVADVGFLRAEVKFLRAFFHFELAKRYGGVPIVTKKLELDEGLNIPRSSFDETVQFIVSECDSIKDKVLPFFKFFDNTKEGRVTIGTVLALKSRVLLYAASPLHNTAGDLQKWQMAAEAANEVIGMGLYALDGSYRDLFLPPKSYAGPEVIWSKRYGESNFIEKANYPIGTDGGQSGTCPSQNLVNAYEKLEGWNSQNPYENRDPRLSATIVVNNSEWNGRTIELWKGGRDGITGGIDGASKTGYYLKKFLVDNLDLSQGQTARHSWILFRYAEVLLNYAEAVNEGYDFNSTPEGFSMTAMEALNMIRSRVSMPDVDASTKEELRELIRQERRIELAFEGHRFWDVRRWKIADEKLNEPLLKMNITKVNDSTFNYTEEILEERFFSEKMYLYPIPQDELIKYEGKLGQNPGW